MKIFTYAAYDDKVSTLQYIADAVKFYTGRDATALDGQPEAAINNSYGVYYIDKIPIIDNRGFSGAHSLPAREKIYVSAAHTGKYLVIALSDKYVGIDIEETVPRVNYQRIASKIGEECASLEDFYKVWTRYEARIKASGVMTAYCKLYNVLGAINIWALPVNYYNVYPTTVIAAVGAGDVEFLPMESIYAAVN